MKKRYYSYVLLLAIPTFIYFNSFGNEFLSLDDGTQVYKNNLIQNLSFKNLKMLFTTDAIGMYSPLTSVYYGIIAAFFGIKTATVFHIFSYLIHLFNLLLVYFLGLRIFKNTTAAVFLSLLFSVHPMAVETVAWVSATSSLLFTACFLLASIFYLKFLETQKVKFYGLCFLSFLAGCFFKVQIIPFVGVLFLLDYLFKKPYLSKKYLLQKLPFIVTALVFGFVALQFKGNELAINREPLNYSRIYFAMNQFFWYLLKLLVPIDIAISYNWPKELTIWHHFYAFALLPLSYLVYHFRKNRLLVFGFLFFIGNLILLTSIFTRPYSPYCVRYSYLASLGLWIILIAVGQQIYLKTKKPWLQYIAYAFLGFLIYLANRETSFWKNSVEIYKKSIAIEETAFDHNGIGIAYTETNVDLKKAEFHLTKALKLEPNNGRYHHDLGFIYARKDAEKAKKHYLEAIRLDPKDSRSYNDLATFYSDSDPKKAEKYLLKAIALDPNLADAYSNLGGVYMQTDSKKAKKYFMKTISINPNHFNAYGNLGILYQKTDVQKAEKYLLKSIALEPQFQTYYYLGNLYFNTNRTKEAIFYLKKALQLNPNHNNSYSILLILSQIYKNSDPKKSKLYSAKAQKLLQKLLQKGK